VRQRARPRQETRFDSMNSVLREPRPRSLPIMTDGSGVARIAETRVTLETLTTLFDLGVDDREIASRYPALSEDAIGAVAMFCLSEEALVSEYIRAQRTRAEAARLRELDRPRPDPPTRPSAGSFAFVLDDNLDARLFSAFHSTCVPMRCMFLEALGLSGTSDEVVLDRLPLRDVLVTHDDTAVVDLAYQIRMHGVAHPGLLVVPAGSEPDDVVLALLSLTHRDSPDSWVDCVHYLD